MRRGDNETRRQEEKNQSAISSWQLAEDLPSAINNPQSVFRNRIDWRKVRRVLVVRLRSIGDTVLTTPSLVALKRFLPEAQIDILLEDWVAPVLEGFREADNVLTVKTSDLKSCFQTAWKLRRNKYDVVFNLHGGTTSTFFARASGAKYRVGFEHYQYNFLYNIIAPSSSEFWQAAEIHSAELQLALLDFTGVPVSDKPKTRLTVTEKALKSLEKKFNVDTQRRGDTNKERETEKQGNREISELRITNYELREEIPHSAFALIHPTASTVTKQWATENFSLVAEFLHEKGLKTIAVGTPKEREVLENLKKNSRAFVQTFDDLSLPEITALASRAKIFVGNDSGIAHIAAAVGTPSVVIFGSSNVNHWRPWTDAPHEIVREEMPCQPCAGYFCAEFDEPECIRRVTMENVAQAIEKVLAQTLATESPVSRLTNPK